MTANRNFNTSAQRSGEGYRDRKDEGADVIQSVQNAGNRKPSGLQNSLNSGCTFTPRLGRQKETVRYDATAATYSIEKLDPERYGTTQLNYTNKAYDNPRSAQEAFEFLDTLTIPKKSVRNVFNQNGQSDSDGERTKSNGGRRGNQGKAEQTEQKKVLEFGVQYDYIQL